MLTFAEKLRSSIYYYQETREALEEGLIDLNKEGFLVYHTALSSCITELEWVEREGVMSKVDARQEPGTKPTAQDLSDILAEYRAVTSFDGGPTVVNLLMVSQIETTNRLVHAQRDTNVWLERIAAALEPRHRVWDFIVKVCRS